MMIIYNRLAAEICSKKSFPLPFRGQEPPETEEPPSAPQGPAFEYALRVRLKRSTVTVNPTPHYTLGVASYTQATSPLRRYLDLCAQRQLLSAISFDIAAYGHEELQQLIDSTEQALSRANAASRDSRRFWLLAYLEDRRRKDEYIEGTVVRIDEGRGSFVELEEIYQVFPLKGLKSPRLGDRLKLRLSRVDPFGDYLRLDFVEQIK
jgi:exoribonuclease-2